MTRKQDRYADKAANQARINGETITAGRNVHEFLESRGSHDERPADHLRAVARNARKRREQGNPFPSWYVGKGSGGAVIRAEGN